MSDPAPPRTQAAPARRRPRALLVLALAAPLLLAASQLRLRPHDQGLLLDVAGTPVDANGRLRGAWQRLVRDCSAVARPAAGDATWQAAQQALAAHSPPASAGARPLQLLQAGDWLLVEVAWDGAPPEVSGAQAARVGSGAQAAPLDPAIVPLHRSAGRWQVVDAGVWSGDTGPWHAPVFIRGWLRHQLPGLPAALPLCLDPRWPVFAGQPR